MSDKNRVIWSEGMFLRPQHLQQHDRYVESLVDGRCRGLRAYDWGFTELVIDQHQLALGKLTITRCRGILPDGTPFLVPEDDDPPLPLDVPEGTQNMLVYLALPVRRSGTSEVDNGEDPESLARYRIAEAETKDSLAGMEGTPLIQIGKLRLRLMLEKQQRDGYLCLGVARVIESRADKNVILDDAYIPPVLDCRATLILHSFVKELAGLIHTRGEALGARVSTAGRGGVAEIADFMLLQAVNRFEPLLLHLHTMTGLHPESLYRVALQLAGELATFARKEKRPIAFAEYLHDDLQATYGPLMEELRKLLSMVLEENAILIPLSPPKYGIRAAKRPDINLLRGANFVLAVNARVSPEILRTRFPTQVKIGPVEQIQQLIRSALPGVAVRALPVAPRQIPYHAGFSYFELDKTSEFWKKMEASGGFAIHVGGDFPELELEFWAIKGS